MLLILQASATHAWTVSSQPRALPHSAQRSVALALQARAEPLDARSCGAATGQEVDKTDGIPNYMLRSGGTVTRLAEGPESLTAVQEDGVVYETDRLVTIITSDVIDMVQQQGGEAEKVDYLQENILVEGLLFDDFKAGDMFIVTPPDSAGDGADVVTLEIVDQRPSSALELADNDDTMRNVASLLSLAAGFAGWTARVTVAGQVRAGFEIAKRE